MKLRVLSFLLLLPVLIFPQEYSFRYYFNGSQSKAVSFSAFEDKRGFLWFCTNLGMHNFDGIHIRDFNRGSELSHKVIYSGFQDSKGIYWFGTLRGVSRYDGSKVQNYREIGKINRMLEDRKGTLWAAAEKAVVRYQNGREVRLSPSEQMLFSYPIKEMVKDSRDNIWFACRSGIIRYDGNSFSKFYEDDMVHAIMCRPNGSILFATNENLMLWDGSSFRALLSLEQYGIRKVNSISADSRGNVWVCADMGLFRFSDNKLTNVPAANDSYYKAVYSIFESSDGILWVNMLKGICKMTPRNFTIFDESKGLAISLINGMIGDRNGNLWLYSYKGGACRFDGSSFIKDFTKGKLDPASIISACYASDGSLWLGTNVNSSLYKMKDGHLTVITSDPHYHRVDKILEGPDKKIWFQVSGRVLCYDGRKVVNFTDAHSQNATEKLLSDAGGQIWILGRDGLKSCDNKVFISQEIFGKNTRDHNLFTSMAIDKRGYFWLGTQHEGIVRYSPKTNLFERITDLQGLPDDEITSLIFDNENNLWIGTKSGLSKLNVREYETSGRIIFKNFGIDDGFTRCNEDAIYRDSNGNIWVGLLDKLAKISFREATEPFVHHEPRVYVTDVKLLYDTSSIYSYSNGTDPKSGLPVNLRLPYDKNYVIFSFTGIDYRDPEGVQYRYRLNGQDYDWSPVTSSNEVIFRNLEPGDYTLVVSARNKDGVWSKTVASFAFTVKPPFWKTWWFYITVSLVFLGLVFTYIRVRTQNLEKLVQLRTQELQEEKQKVERINSELEKSRYQLAKINELQAKWLDDLAESERYLKEVNSSKDKFFSIISHDLKSPFNALLKYSESVVENIDDLSNEELRDFTLKVSRYSKNVYNLVENLLDWSRIQTGRMVYEPVNIGLLQTVKESITVQEASASKKKITLVNNLHSDFPVFADKNMALAVFNNLISNGIKFTNAGGSVEISAVKKDGFAEITVADNGIGLEEEEIARLFKIDAHFFKTGTSGEKGTGLGLILCRELIEKNGGSIFVESKPGEGSRFKFTLPLA